MNMHLSQVEKKSQVVSLFAKIHTYLKVAPAHWVLVIGMIAILAVAVTTVFIRLQTEQVIAPPGLRVLDWLWKVFICRCPG